MSEWHNRWLRWTKLRFAILYPLGLAALFFAHGDDRSLRLSVAFLTAGLLLRVWANGYAIKTDKLTICGPYAFVRNPLYLGSTLIVLGFIILLKLSYAGLAFFLVWIAIYAQTIGKEERALAEKFKDDYFNYKKNVPAVIPCLFPYKAGEKWGFSLTRLLQSEEYKVFIWIIILIIFFYIKEKWLEDKHALLKHGNLILLAFLLGSIDLISEFLKWKKKHSSRTPA